MSCPFCRHLEEGGARLIENDLSVAIFDNYPLNPGHTLIIPRVHVAELFDLTPVEQASLWELVAEAKVALDIKHEPDGYNIGVNVGAAAGQTVGHVHIHLIPRMLGDVADPRGGVRWVVPQRAAYWPKEKSK